MTGAADSVTGWRHHWEVLKESWAAETARRANLVQWKEADFLPAALEVVETPPNPLGRIILWTIMVFAVLALVWSIIAKLDVVAVAPGKVITSGRNKLVQAADAGTVREIHVRDGERVTKGQALVTLDPTNAGAEQAQAAANLQAAQIDMARSNALLAALRGGRWSFVAPEGTPEPLAATQRLLISTRVAELEAKIATLREQASEARAIEAGARAETARLSDTLPLLTERVEKRRQLAEKGFSSRLGQLELEQQKIDHERQILVQRQNMARARANMAGVNQQIAMARAEAVREVLADLAKAEADARLAREELTKATQRQSQQVLRSPVDGVVQQLAIYSEGAVLKAADPILVVVPDSGELIVEAQVLNRDAGFVEAGQPVTVKLEAFPFTRYGTLEGKLAWISRDAIQDEKLGPVYAARVTVTPPPRGSTIEVTPGLAASAEIRTDERRVIDYLLSPLERAVSEAGRER